jgi:hypothetical protein
MGTGTDAGSGSGSVCAIVGCAEIEISVRVAFSMRGSFFHDLKYITG